MTPEVWQRVKAVFNTAITLPPQERASYLDSACGGDPSLRAEVESLLSADAVADFPSTPLAAPDSQIAPEQMIGRYRVLSHLGSGGMGDVYLAEDPRLGRRVALKLLSGALRQDPARLQRFEREARAASQLAHPNVCVVYEIGETSDERRFIAMEYIEGESLRAILERHRTAGTRIPFEQTLDVVLQVASGLAVAHAAGIVHRDVKPENIMCRPDGLVKLLDFGLAKHVQAQPLGSDSPALPGGQTESGTVLGTVLYMSPEQARGLPVDARTDVWSLGVVLYEMLTGRPPFEGESGADVMVAILDRQPIPLDELAPTLPPGLSPIVGRTLAKDRNDRFSTLTDLGSSLKTLQYTRVSPAPSSWPKHGVARRLTKSRTVMALGVLAVGTTFGIWHFRNRPADTGPQAVRLAVIPFENLGPETDDYFASGLTAAARSKLSELPLVQVTALRSSNQYARTSKPPQQIGAELGVEYLLTARVRWQKTGGETSRVQVTPALIQVATGSTRWLQSFDVPLQEVFRTQSDIALRVAESLLIPVPDSVQRSLTEWPTQSVVAYDAYLKGRQASGYDQQLAFYEQAVSLDSAFAEAWAEISMTHSDRYFNGTPTTAESQQARHAAERALALAPDRAFGYHALGWYHWAVTKDYERAADEFTQGLKAAPNDVQLLTDGAVAATALGLWEVALARLQRAYQLDRRSAHTTLRLATALLSVRRYAEAQIAADSALALAPDNPHTIRVRAMVALAQGDLPGARAIVAALPRDAPASAVAALAWHNELYWVLPDSLQRVLLRSTPDDFNGDRSSWGIVLAETHWFRGARAKARAYADSARVVLEQQLGAAPGDPQLHVFRGIMLAYLGRKPEAMQEGERAVAQLPIGKSADQGAYIQHQLARIYILVGEPEKALNQLEPLLKVPYYLSSGWLKVDPEFIPLRNIPRFQRLIAGSQTSPS